MREFYKDLLYYSSSIVITIVFLIFSTYYWFNVKEFNVSAMEINNSNITITGDYIINDLQKLNNTNNKYQISITNSGDCKETFKLAICNLFIKNNINNNYIKYSVNNNYVKTLNNDGIIYINEINPQESLNLEIKLWISDTYDGTEKFTGTIDII